MARDSFALIPPFQKELKERKRHHPLRLVQSLQYPFAKQISICLVLQKRKFDKRRSLDNLSVTG